jgi:hypothetical protein
MRKLTNFQKFLTDLGGGGMRGGGGGRGGSNYKECLRSLKEKNPFCFKNNFLKKYENKSNNVE